MISFSKYIQENRRDIEVFDNNDSDNESIS